MKLTFGRIISILVVAGGWLLAGARLVLDLIGYATVPDDSQVATGLLRDFLLWLLSVPWWVPWGFALASTLVLIWVSWPRLQIPPQRVTTVGVPQQQPATPPANPPRKKTRPIFGIPRQLAGEHYLSWWHIPITVEGPGGSPTEEIRHCTAELLNANGIGDPIKLRWQADNEPAGVEEITLLEGVDRMIPVVKRCETGSQAVQQLPGLADGIARITGAAYLRDKDWNKFKLSEGRYDFRLLVKAGKKSWESPHIYRLRTGKPVESNGSFIVEVRPG